MRKVLDRLSHFEKKKKCLDKIKVLRVTMQTNLQEYKDMVETYFDLLMIDLGRGATLSKSEAEFVQSNISLLKRYPEHKQEEYRKVLGLDTEKKPLVEKVKSPNTEVKKMKLSEIYPEKSTDAVVKKYIDNLKKAYVPMWIGVKFCKDIINYIENLEFSVPTRVTGKSSQQTAMTM